MPPVFKPSKGPTLGVEVEIQLVGRKGKDLVPGAITLLGEAAKEKNLRVKSEFTQAMIEVFTGIHRNISDLEADVREQIERVRQIAEGHEMELAISGTHPFQDWRQRSIYPTARYVKILEKFQWIARRLTLFSLHVHVGVSSGERAIHILNEMILYLPPLLALSASSPFWGGIDTGMASCRTAVFGSMPTGGLPPRLADWKEFRRYFDALKSAGVITSIKDIYWDIRPHFDFGTVEVRICDGMHTIEEMLALTAMIQSLVVWIDSRYEAPRSPQKNRRAGPRSPRYWMAPENKWQAARYGLDGVLIGEKKGEKRTIREEVWRLLEVLDPVAKKLQCHRQLQSVRKILEHGNGANRQRLIFSQTKSLVAVVDGIIEELRR